MAPFEERGRTWSLEAGLLLSALVVLNRSHFIVRGPSHCYVVCCNKKLLLISTMFLDSTMHSLTSVILYDLLDLLALLCFALL